MKIFLLLFLAALLLFGCKEEKAIPNHEKLELVVHVGGVTKSSSYWGPNNSYGDSLKSYLLIAAEIKNNSNDTISFTSMLCSKEDFFTLTKSDSFYTSGVPCYANGPTTNGVLPKSSVDIKLVIGFLHKRLREDTLQLGMYYHSFSSKPPQKEIMDEKGCPVLVDKNIYEQFDEMPIIWSEPYPMSRFYWSTNY